MEVILRYIKYLKIPYFLTLKIFYFDDFIQIKETKFFNIADVVCKMKLEKILPFYVEIKLNPILISKIN